MPLQQCEGKHLLQAALLHAWHAVFPKALTGLLPAEQAARAPHHDLSAAEVESALRLSEHLLHLQRLQRRGLAAAAERHGSVATLAAGLAELAAAPDALPAQVADSCSAVHILMAKSLCVCVQSLW